jgi:NAD(P)-dependent dehydrogenase (short-subunit alcohol dehydrogenase family)
MDGYPLALITGGAHRLGKVFALALARRGFAILLHHYLSIEDAAETADEIRRLGVPAFIVQGDLTNEVELNSLFLELDSLPHRLKILVNSAAVMRKSNIRDTTAADWDAIFALNLRAPFQLAQQAARRMVEGGLIINISDVGAHKLWTGYPAYVVSKAALETLTRLLAKAYGPAVRVNAIAPGLVMPSESVTSEDWDTLVERLPLKHPVALSDISTALTFLLDNDSVTGQTVVVDGGYSLI